ncbi:TetR/AcrR family transcriptional regulator [Aeromicrobium phragmitis]|uniref:TetR/AcrR family transcriptional regulator n=1 Tax=Aeromicrobium phragmitis TaxID=2478914 RepID=A0A3L8PLS3_9ACTN|nr:TetR/AcrR family transcriptional regulator [Aeromicrobium phragmitis]RLV54962.1 TetR/AcrR family transcriptional regulator [Aeromicrobium phragmitis]
MVSSSPGRPRNEGIDRAVLDATMEVLDELGYQRLTIAEVASRAGATKPALYRRWPSRPWLVIAALHRELRTIESPDTTCTLCDLHESIGLFAQAFGTRYVTVLGPLLADCAGDQRLRRAFLDGLLEPARDAVRHTLVTAVQRGDLRPDLDLDLAVDMLGAVPHYRAILGQSPLTSGDIERAVVTLLRGIAVDYDALVAHSLTLEAAPPPHEQHVPAAPTEP